MCFAEDVEIATMSNDYLVNAALEHQDLIFRAYELHEKGRPIVLFDIEEQRIYVYPYKEFKEDLTPRNQVSLQDQYEKALSEDEIVVFVRDNVERKLVSFSLARERGDTRGSRARKKKRRRR